MTYKEFVLQQLESVVAGFKEVIDVVEKDKIPENEDWLKAAIPLQETMNILLNYGRLKDEEFDSFRLYNPKNEEL